MTLMGLKHLTIGIQGDFFTIAIEFDAYHDINNYDRKSRFLLLMFDISLKCFKS